MADEPWKDRRYNLLTGLPYDEAPRSVVLENGSRLPSAAYAELGRASRIDRARELAQVAASIAGGTAAPGAREDAVAAVCEAIVRIFSGADHAA